MVSETENSRNVVLFPFMAQGHIIPFIALANQLQKKHNCTITFVTTKLNIPKISSSLPPNSSIHLLTIPFCGSGHGLPPGVENTDVLPYHLLPNFFQASFSLKPSFRKLISDLSPRPLCIIADMFFGWSHEIAREFGVFHALFCGGGAFGFACFHSLWLNLPHLKNVTNETITVPDFPEASRIHVTQMSENLRDANGDKFTAVIQKLLSLWENADAMLFNTVEELEAKTGLLYFRRKLGRPAWPIGPVVLPVLARKEGAIITFTSEMCIKWLDSKPAWSVLYVSFGSMNTISTSQMMELAMALESSGKNFIWVVRPPIGYDINGEFRAEEWLPKGFEDRIRESERGLIVHKWAPQVDILSHEAVSAFLSHCGWNSVIEALTHGVPIIGWPLAADQFYNAKFLEEELGVCVEVARGKSSRVGHEEMVKKIELVMKVGSEKGNEIRRKVCEVGDIMRDALRDENGCKGSSIKAMDEFLNAALLKRETYIMSTSRMIDNE
ncbi:UDP-glycosyltransferase 92A1 [Morus notabilis]|uniref:Glycosyltransferase n=1 Tax=Morus notabilis TaxID=981085 RepID=W9QXF4_9ROSA|nr:UDP-glycosyltransferase 92A1 isoform X1 [Morus notabilis]EXB48394.1 UDP-glycosyltransferase 92A1 [Morus notabilis]